MRITQVDAFADRPFAGNPAAVCVLDRPVDDGWMQNVALEMNLSETAFTHPEPGGDGWRLRWFTPVCEVDLCGHATLATAHVLWEEGHLGPAEVARFQTRSGLLTATPRPGGWIELDFPAEPVEPVEPNPPLSSALGIVPRFVGRNRLDMLVEVADEAAVRAYVPDGARLAEIPVRGVILTAAAEASSGFDFVSRFFAPRVGILEDPVCGSAHCGLAPYWAARLGKPELMAQQVSARGGVLKVRTEGDRVALAGKAVTVLRGELLAEPPHAP